VQSAAVQAVDSRRGEKTNLIFECHTTQTEKAPGFAGGFGKPDSSTSPGAAGGFLTIALTNSQSVTKCAAKELLGALLQAASAVAAFRDIPFSCLIIYFVADIRENGEPPPDSLRLLPGP
jgi:hypothetical protein